MKLICWWLGTDALTLTKTPPGTLLWHLKLFFYRLKWKLLKDRFEHWSVHENLNYHLDKVGIKAKIKVDPPLYPKKVEKIPHEGFNVLYYRPSPVNLGGHKYIDWYYGFDIYYQLLKYFLQYPEVRLLIADGTKDMNELYQITDCYIRPNRWDGMPRMVLECQINEIPYMWCDKIKDGYLNPQFDEFKTFILNEYESWKMRNRNPVLSGPKAV
jgi:hypothetical protein